MTTAPVDDWRDVIAKLGRMGIGFKVRNGGALVKCGSVNYFPTTGRVQIDGARAFPKIGFAFLLEVLADEGIKRA